ncbi:uncharacterized protein METZ01_LOCUS420093, partial [marine metagenome]
MQEKLPGLYRHQRAEVIAFSGEGTNPQPVVPTGLRFVAKYPQALAE